MEIDTFKSFGKQFQEKVMQALLCDHNWASQMMEVMKPEYFEVNHLKYLYEAFSKHYTLYKTFPSLQLLGTIVKDELRASNDEMLCLQVISYIQLIKSNPNPNDLPYVKDRSLNFCKNQALKEALSEAVDLTREQKYEQIVDKIKNAITVGTPHSTGHDFFNDFESRFVVEDRKTISTGIDALDAKDIMNGGLGAGELGAVLASTGVGKSHFLVQLGANAMRKGKNVLHYTFELRENKVAMRYDANFTNVQASDVLSEKELIRKKLDELRPSLGRLIIKEYPTSTATALTLRAHIEKIAITNNFKPDVIIVDYADIMRSTRQFDALRHEQKLIYEELRALAMEFDVPVWTASQSNRESVDIDVLGIDKMSESFAKAHICDFIVSLARKPMQKAAGVGNMFIPKSRLGKDGIVFPIKIDTARSIITVLDKEIDTDEFSKSYENDVKKLLKQKWNEVANDKLIELRNITREVG